MMHRPQILAAFNLPRNKNTVSMLPVDEDPESLLELLELDLLPLSPFFSPRTGNEEATYFSSTTECQINQ